MKKLLNLFVVLGVMLSINLNIVNADGADNSAQDTIVVESDNIISSLEYLGENGHVQEYTMNENGDVFVLGIDSQHDVFFIDGRQVDSMLFEALVNKQIELDKNNVYSKGSINYSIRKILSGIPQLRCTTCGNNPMYPPTSGYGSLIGAGSGNVRIEVQLTAAAYALGAKLLGVNITTATGIYKTLMKMYGGGSSYLYYKRYQAQHLTCRSATLEQRVYYYDKELKQATGKYGNFYFYSSKPY